jgi:hypothetical protein
MDTKAYGSGSAQKKSAFDSKVRLRRIDNLIFVICVIIATVFWGSIKLSEFYSESYVLYISYNNVPAEKKLTALDDTTVAVTINARGFTILRMRLFEDMNNLNINLDNFTIEQREGNHFFVNTQEMKDRMSELFGLDETKFDFSKTTLGFVLEDLSEKKVSVRENLLLNFKQEYDLYERATLTPEEVTVFGPKDMLDSITMVYTENVQQSLIDSDMSVEVRISNPYPDLLRFSPDAVTVNLRVEQYTESFIDTPVDFSGIKEQIKSFPNIVRVNFQVARKDFTLVQSGQFQVVPELEGVDIQNTDRLHLKLIRQPDIVRNPWIVPADVEFLIIK